MIRNLYKEGCTQNRELSWLRFDDRCLNEAKDKTVPLLERLKFVSIYTSNLTEFFRVRVGSLFDMKQVNVARVDNKSGMTPQQQLNEIYRVSKRTCKKRDEIYLDLKKRLAKAGVEDVSLEECTKAELKYLRKYFRREISPLLSPQIVDSHHPFPNLQNNVIYAAAMMKYKNKSSFGLIPVPSVLPEIILLPAENKLRFVHTEDVILNRLPEIFPDVIVEESMKIAVARSAYVDPEDALFDHIVDYKKKMQRVLKERRKMNITRVDCSKKPSTAFRKYLLTHLGTTQQALFVQAVPMSMKYVFSLEKSLPAEIAKDLVFERYEPKLTPALDYSENLFDQIQKKDVLLSYPYESMEPFLRLLKESASDPNVVSIKITIYRLASHARLVDYLCLAAENGKEVDVLIELKARFDEQNNIDYSERLEDAGCNVIYGFDNYKVHSKICLITRMNGKKPEHCALISTGNFNENTAKQYTDLALLTSRAAIVKDGLEFFKNMYMGVLDGEYHSLLVAPVSLKSTILSLIDREIEKGAEGRILCKVNAVTDEEIIRKLIEASCAGVKITLLVRGISCILPGVPGKTENIEIMSIVGRYLEHSRVYVFGKGLSERMYISSADFMTRNTERRVEIACPIQDANIRRRIREYLALCMADTAKARKLMPNGRLHKIQTDDEPIASQDVMMEKTQGEVPVEAARPAARQEAVVFHGKRKKEKKE